MLPRNRRFRRLFFAPAALCACLSRASALTSSWFPNPFDSRAGSTTILVELSSPADVSIDIYDLFGRRVRRLAIAGAAGTNTATWDGSDSAGRKVSKGVYVAVVRAGGESATYKIGVIH